MAQKRPKPRKCPKCGKISRTKGNICLNKECREVLPLFTTRVVANNPDTAPADVNTNEERGISMNTFGKIWLFIVILIASIAALIFSTVSLPILLGGWALVCAIGAIFMIISGILGILKGTVSNDRFQKNVNNNYLAMGWYGFILFVLPILIWALIFVCGSFNKQLLNTNSTATNSAATNSTVVTAEGKSEQIDANTVHLFVLNPTASPQTQIGHPSVYIETHVSGNPITYVFDIPQGYVGIVGGYNVDGTDKGVYKAFGPGHYEIVVTDGFGLITNDNWAQAEFEFRIGQAVEYNWAHAHIVAGPLTDPTK